MKFAKLLRTPFFTEQLQRLLLTFNSYFQRGRERKPVRLSVINTRFSCKKVFTVANVSTSVREIIPWFSSFHFRILSFFWFCYDEMVLLWVDDLLRRNQLVNCASRNWKLYQSQILSKNADTFLEISFFFFRCYCHFFAIVNQLPGFSIGRLANVGKFFNVNIFFKCKLNKNVSINNHPLYLCSMLLETSFLLSHLLCNVDFELIRVIEFQNKANIEIIGI